MSSFWKELTCTHEYTIIKQFSYCLDDGNKYHCTLLECKNCGKREVEFTSYPAPLSLNNLTFKWKIGEYNADTVSNILCGIKDGE